MLAWSDDLAGIHAAVAASGWGSALGRLPAVQLTHHRWATAAAAKDANRLASRKAVKEHFRRLAAELSLHAVSTRPPPARPKPETPAAAAAAVGGGYNAPCPDPTRLLLLSFVPTSPGGGGGERFVLAVELGGASALRRYCDRFSNAGKIGAQPGHRAKRRLAHRAEAAAAAAAAAPAGVDDAADNAAVPPTPLTPPVTSSPPSPQGAGAGGDSPGAAPVPGAGAIGTRGGAQQGTILAELAAVTAPTTSPPALSLHNMTPTKPALSLLMANLARVDRGSVVYDPFCGSYGLLAGARQLGAYTIGTAAALMLLLLVPSGANPWCRLSTDRPRPPPHMPRAPVRPPFLPRLRCSPTRADVGDPGRPRPWQRRASRRCLPPALALRPSHRATQAMVRRHRHGPPVWYGTCRHTPGGMISPRNYTTPHAHTPKMCACHIHWRGVACTSHRPTPGVDAPVGTAVGRDPRTPIRERRAAARAGRWTVPLG